MSAYYLRLLGGRPEVWKGDEVVYKQLQPALMLAYLHCEGKQLRLDIANLFFPDVADKQKRLGRLSEALRLIEKAIPNAIQKLEDEYIGTNINSDIQSLIRVCEHEDYEFIDDIYRGHFLQKVEQNQRLGLEDNESLYSWLLNQRETVLDVARNGLLDFAELKVAQEDFKEAGKLAKRVYKFKTEHSFFLPNTYSRLYKLLTAANSSEAIPLIKEAILHYGQEEFTVYSDFQDARRSLLTPNNLPQISDTLIGRQLELTECTALLRGDSRLLTLIGPAGTGKTAFAQKLSRNLRGYKTFRDGVYVLWLEQLSRPEDVIASIAQCLNINISANKTPLDSVADALGDQAILLYLDNFEHLLEAIRDIDQLLARCPNLRIVLSSREVVISDWVTPYDLQGLAYPTENTIYDFEDVATYAAVELVVGQGQRVSSSFELSEDNYEAVVDICQQVGGLALGLKLAASWLHSSSAQAIAEELKGSMALLDTVQHNQRGVSTALELSWQRLTEAEQDAFCKLAVFNGGFNLQAAQSICDSGIVELSSLQNKSLVEWDAAKERYSLHPLIRRFVELKAEASVLEGLKLKHSTYYLELLRIITDGTQEERNGAVRLLKPEVYNIQDAWQQAVDNQDLDELRDSAHAVERFFDDSSNYIIGSEMLESAIRNFGKGTSYQRQVLGVLLASQAWLRYRLFDYEVAIKLAERALELDTNHFQTESTSINVLGSIYYRSKNYDLAEKLYKKGLEISKDFKGHYATVLGNMGNMERDRGNFEKAAQYYSESLTVRKKMKQTTRLAGLLRQIGVINVDKGKLGKARKCFEEAGAIAETLQNNHELIYLRRDLLNLQLNENNFVGLDDSLQELLKESKLLKNTMLEIDILILLTRLHHLKENEISALEYLQNSIEIELRQNKYYRVYEIHILLLLIGKKMDIKKCIKLQSILSTSAIQYGMSFVEKTEFKNIVVDPSADAHGNQVAKDKFETVYRLLESWGFPQLSIHL